MAPAFVKAGSVTFLVVIVAFILQRRNDQQLTDKMQTVLKNLLRAERKIHGTPIEPRRVAIGLGSCLDSFTTALQLFDRVAVNPPAKENVKHYNSFGTKKELAEGFAYFFKSGAAAERYVHDKLLFKRLVAAAHDIPDTKWTVGGNAPVMANRMAKEGCQVLLGSVVSDTIAREIETNVRVTKHSAHKTDEEVHLILEYKTGETWGDFTAPRANRFILHSDSTNSLLSSLESFREQLTTFKPHAVVIGGLQMMDNFPFQGDTRSQRLNELRQMLIKDVPSNVPIHFEFASFVEEATALDVLSNVVLYADSLGMNEQELPNLYSLLNYRNISIISDPYPRVATILDQMRSVYESLKKARDPNTRALTRLHVHTLAFQAILTTQNSRWKNAMSAAAKASLTAHRHVCGSKQVDLAKSLLIMDESFSLSRQEGSDRILFQNNRPVSCWKEEDYEICLAPVLVCTQVSQTAGGGDNISAAALAAQI